MIQRLLRQLRRLKRASTTPVDANSVLNRELDADMGLVGGKGITAGGKVVDFDADQKPPRY